MDSRPLRRTAPARRGGNAFLLPVVPRPAPEVPGPAFVGAPPPSETGPGRRGPEYGHRIRRPLSEGEDLLLRQFAPDPGLQLPQKHPPHGDAFQFHHRMPQGFAHPADLPRDPLDEDHAQPGVLGLRAVQDLHPLHPRPLPIQREPPAPHLQGPLRRRPADLDLVGLLDMVRRMLDGFGPVSVVGQQKKALGGVIQPPHGLHPGGQSPQDVGQVPPPLGIIQAGDHVLRLVKGDVHVGLELDPLAAHLDGILLRVHGGGQGRHHGAVDRDRAFGDEGLHAAARTQPRMGEEFIQP